MEKKRIILYFCFLAIISSLICAVSASITIDSVKDLYNLGDKIYISTTIIPQDVQGKFEINLNCEGKTINIERMSAEPRFISGEEAKYSTYITLIPEYIDDLKGKCNVQISLGSDIVSTKSFFISDKVLTTTSLDKQSYNPGDVITLTLNAKKENGDKLNGFFKSSGAFESQNQIKDGNLIEKFTIPQDYASGSYIINIAVYDSLGEQKLNHAETLVSFKVNQVPKSIGLTLSDSELNPDSTLTIRPELLDQTGKSVDESVSIRVLSPVNKEIQKTLKSGEQIDLYFPVNATAGTWKVFSTFANLNEERDFLINKQAKVSFGFVDNVLVIKNSGNDLFSGKINVTIGNEIHEVDVLDLQAGEEKKYSLEAPDGEYVVAVSDGGNKSEQRLLLTGRAISISEFNGAGIFSRYPIVWTFVFIILLVFASVSLLNIRKTPFKLIGDLKEKHMNTPKEIEVSDDYSFKTRNKVSEAEHSLVLKGEKQTSSIVALKINNLNRLSDTTKQEIRSFILASERKNGVIDQSNEYFIIIFNPSVTKTFSNEFSASDFGIELHRKLLELNKKIAQKIDFGIGIHNGELISNIENGKLKYTSIGNTILLAKRMADLKQEKVYASEDLRKKLLKDLRAEKVNQIGSVQVYSVLGVTNRTNNEAKLEDLLRRIGN